MFLINLGYFTITSQSHSKFISKSIAHDYYHKPSPMVKFISTISFQKEIELMAKEVYLQLMNMFDESSENISRSIQLSLHWNITTVFGVLLDYPVVYWYKDKEGETCLGNKDLINFKLKNTAHIKTWAIERDVYSFTVPTCVINEELNSFVEKWLTQLLECANTHNVILTCEKNQVNLSTVLL